MDHLLSMEFNLLETYYVLTIRELKIILLLLSFERSFLFFYKEVSQNCSLKT